MASCILADEQSNIADEKHRMPPLATNTDGFKIPVKFIQLCVCLFLLDNNFEKKDVYLQSSAKMAIHALTNRSFSFPPSKAKATIERPKETGKDDGLIINNLLQSLNA